MIVFTSNGVKFRDCSTCVNEKEPIGEGTTCGKCMDGISRYVRKRLSIEGGSIVEERNLIEFTDEEFSLIMEYTELVEEDTVQAAIMDAISIAMIKKEENK